MIKEEYYKYGESLGIKINDLQRLKMLALTEKTIIKTNNMTTKEKAKQLVDMFTMDNIRQGERNAIKCALIAVDELINQCYDYRLIDLGCSCGFWVDVKNEINKL